MNLDWIAGFLDGEGSVSLLFHKMPSCKYGYQFLPAIIITQKTRSILEAIQLTLGLGRLYRHRQSDQYTLEIRKQSEIRDFIRLFSERTQLKRRQLELLKEALSHLHDGPLRGNQLWGGAMPKENVLRLLDIVTEIRGLNGIRGKRVNDVASIRRQVQNFDEQAYQIRIRESWRKRIAPLVDRRSDSNLPSVQHAG